MRTISVHQFGDVAAPDSFTIQIQELMHEDYGLYVWPSSLVLAEFIFQQRAAFSGKRVLELGAGTALPGIVAAKVGSSVILTDHAEKAEVFENLQGTCALNQVECQLQGLTWGELDGTPDGVLHSVDFIIGADVLYESRAFEALFSTVRMLLEHSPGAMFVTAYQHRSGHYSIEYLLAKWQLRCVHVIRPDEFVPPTKMARLQSTIEIAVVTLA